MDTAPAPPSRLLPLALACGLLLLSLVASGRSVWEAERVVFNAAQDLPAATAVVLVPVMQAGTLLAGPIAAALAIAARRRQLAIELLCAGVGAWVVSRALKLVVMRPRPTDLLDEVVLRGAPVQGFGFPSGHVTVAAALAAVAAAWLPRPWAGAAWVVVGLVAVARLHIGAHLPLDVAGGLLLGALVGVTLRALSSTRGVRRAFTDPDG